MEVPSVDPVLETSSPCKWRLGREHQSEEEVMLLSPKFTQRSALLVLLFSSFVAPGISQTVPDRVFRDVDGKPLPFQTDAEAEAFLRAAEVTSQKNIGVGVTKPKQLVLEKDGLKVHAAFNYVDREGQREKLEDGSVEMYFLDSYKADIATYKLSRLLDMEMIPPGVERQVGDDVGVVRLWIEDLESYDEWIEEGNTGTPDSLYVQRQIKDQIVFDLLIRNTDRNRGNINWDPDENLWMIDQTRSLARVAELRDKEAKKFKGSSRALYEAMMALEASDVERELGPYIGKFELKALMKRRDKLVKLIDTEVKKKGEDEILFNYTDAPKGLVIDYGDE